MNRNDLDEFGQKTLWVSFSRLNEFEKCQQKVILKMAHKDATIKEGRNFVSGTVADRSMRKWLEQPEGTHEPGQMEAYVHELWEKYTVNSDEYKVTWKDTEDEVRAKRASIEAVKALEPFLTARVLPFDYEPEWRFQVPLKMPWAGAQRTCVLNGGADIVVRNNDTGMWSVYDLKTTRNENYIQGYTTQLVFYQMIVHMLFDVPYEQIRCAFLTPLTPIQYHELTPESADRRNLIARLMRFTEFIWKDETPTCTDNVSECFFCPVKINCPRWADVPATARDDGKNRISLRDTAQARKAAKDVGN